MIFNARKRAAVSVTLADLLALWEAQNGLCAITQIKMTWGRGRIQPTSMSIDRINPTLDYSPGNIRLICHAVNCFRQGMSDDEMFTMAMAIITGIKRPRLQVV